MITRLPQPDLPGPPPIRQPSPDDYQFANRPTLTDPEACLKVVPVGASTFVNAPQFQITAPINIVPGSDPPVLAGGDCADLGSAFASGYKPRMYALAGFFQDWIDPRSTTPLPLGFAGAALFSGTAPPGFFSLWREVYYGSLGWDARTSLLIPLS